MSDDRLLVVCRLSDEQITRRGKISLCSILVSWRRGGDLENEMIWNGDEVGISRSGDATNGEWKIVFSTKIMTSKHAYDYV